MSGRLLDEGMNQVSDRRWQVKVLPHPDISTSDSGRSCDHLGLLGGSAPAPRLQGREVRLRDHPCGHCGVRQANLLPKANSPNYLHPFVSPTCHQQRAKVDIIIENTGDGCMNVLKILYLEKTVPSKAAMAFFAAGHLSCLSSAMVLMP